MSALEHAFGLLLGRSLNEFDPGATYGVFSYIDETATEALAEIDPADLVAPPSTASSRSVDPGPGAGWFQGRWKDDLGGSAFVIPADAEPELVAKLRPVLHGSGLDADAKPDPDPDPDAGEDPARRHPALLTGDAGAIVWGRDLGRMLLDGTVTRAELRDDQFEYGEVYLPMLVRAQTDGSLFDAMCAATSTMSAPDGLFDFAKLKAKAKKRYGETVKVDKRWKKVLREIPDRALRNHFRWTCLDAHWARSHGAYYLGPGVWPGDLTALGYVPGHEIVAGWIQGEGQGAIAVVSLGPAARSTDDQGSSGTGQDR